MYDVTNAYKTAIAAAGITSDIEVDIDGTTYGAQNIVAGTFFITNQCTSTADITLGSVYLGELSATFIIPEAQINRNSWQGRQITPTYKLWTGNDWESLPLGIFTVSEATWTENGIKVTAYDNMKRFDEASSFEAVSAYPFDILAAASTACQVTFANTRAQIEAMPNGNRLFYYQKDNDIKTWRDVLYYVAQLLCGFATINRAGELEIRQFSTSPVDTIATNRREYSASFSDYTTKYTALQYTKIDTQEEITVKAQPNDGLTINIGSNPFLQDSGQGVATALQAILTAIAQFTFTPFRASVAGNPAFDLGDALTFTGGRAGQTALACITYYKFTNHRKYEMVGYGANPAIAQNTKDQKQTAASTQAAVKSLSRRVQDASRYGIVFLSPTEAKNQPIYDGEARDILLFSFKVDLEKAPVAVHALIETQVDTLLIDDEYTDCVVTITVTDSDGDTLAEWDESFGDGMHVLNIDIIKKYYDTGDHDITVTISPHGGNLL